MDFHRIEVKQFSCHGIVLMNDIGIYILTYPGDYHLSTALIRSLRHFAANVPVMIIPGEGFDRNDHPFDVPIMREPKGFWAQMKHIDRKFWCYQGPFEKFLYIDADIICTRSLAPFIQNLRQKSSSFISVELCIEDDAWLRVISDPKNSMHKECLSRVAQQLGNVTRLNDFDPNYDPYAHYPFNAGLFASNRLAISEDAFEDLHNKETRYFNEKLKKKFEWKSHDLFFADQGRLNYLVEKLGIERSTLFPHGHYLWGGVPQQVPLEKVMNGDVAFNFIHWAGCPRPSPSLFCKQPLLPLLQLAYIGLPKGYKVLNEIPAYSVWKHFLGEDEQKVNRVSERIKWTWRDAKMVMRKASTRWLKNTMRKQSYTSIIG